MLICLKCFPTLGSVVIKSQYFEISFYTKKGNQQTCVTKPDLLDPEGKLVVEFVLKASSLYTLNFESPLKKIYI